MAAAKSRKLELAGDSEDIFAKGNQVYTIPTYDAAFKWVLTCERNTTATGGMRQGQVWIAKPNSSCKLAWRMNCPFITAEGY